MQQINVDQWRISVLNPFGYHKSISITHRRTGHLRVHDKNQEECGERTSMILYRSFRRPSFRRNKSVEKASKDDKGEGIRTMAIVLWTCGRWVCKNLPSIIYIFSHASYADTGFCHLLHSDFRNSLCWCEVSVIVIMFCYWLWTSTIPFLLKYPCLFLCL